MNTDFRQFCVQAGEYRIHYVDEGDGPPVVLVHGSPLSSHSFRHQIAALAPRFRVIVPDQLGFGQSTIPEKGAAFIEQAMALRHFLDHLALDSFRLVLHDWGGPSGMAAVSDRLSQLRQLVLLNTTVRPDFAPPFYWRQFTSITGELLLVKLNVFRRGLPALMQAARRRDVRQYYHELLDPIGTRWTMLRLERLEGYAPLMEEVQQTLRDIDLPVLLIWGTPDPYFSERELAYLQSIFPQVSVARLPGGGHFSMEDAPHALSDALLDFLSI